MNSEPEISAESYLSFGDRNLNLKSAIVTTDEYNAFCRAVDYPDRLWRDERHLDSRCERVMRWWLAQAPSKTDLIDVLKKFGNADLMDDLDLEDEVGRVQRNKRAQSSHNSGVFEAMQRLQNSQETISKKSCRHLPLWGFPLAICKDEYLCEECELQMTLRGVCRPRLWDNDDKEEIDDEQTLANEAIKPIPVAPQKAQPAASSSSSTTSTIFNECVVCMDGPKEVVLMPCSHLLACRKCADDLSACPLCSVAVTSRIKVYLV